MNLFSFRKKPVATVEPVAQATQTVETVTVGITPEQINKLSDFSQKLGCDHLFQQAMETKLSYAEGLELMTSSAIKEFELITADLSKFNPSAGIEAVPLNDGSKPKDIHSAIVACDGKTYSEKYEQAKIRYPEIFTAYNASQGQ